MSCCGLLERTNRDLRRQLEQEKTRSTTLQNTLQSFTSLLQYFKPHLCAYKNDIEAYNQLRCYIESANVLHHDLKTKQNQIIELEQQKEALQIEFKKLEEELVRLRAENEKATEKEAEWKTTQEENIRLKKRINRINSLEKNIKTLNSYKEKYMQLAKISKKAKPIKDENKKENSVCDVYRRVEEEYPKMENKWDKLNNEMSGVDHSKWEEQLKNAFGKYKRKVQSLSQTEQLQYDLLLSRALDKFKEQHGTNDKKIKSEHKKKDSISSRVKSIKRRKKSMWTRAYALLNDISSLYNELDSIALQKQKSIAEIDEKYQRIIAYLENENGDFRTETFSKNLVDLLNNSNEHISNL